MDLFRNTKLKLIQWNARNIKQRTTDIIPLLRNDILCIQETWLNNKDQFKLKNFNIIRKDREEDTVGGGVLIAVKDNIEYTNLNININNRYILKKL